MLLSSLADFVTEIHFSREKAAQANTPNILFWERSLVLVTRLSEASRCRSMFNGGHARGVTMFSLGVRETIWARDNTLYEA